MLGLNKATNILHARASVIPRCLGRGLPSESWKQRPGRDLVNEMTRHLVSYIQCLKHSSSLIIADIL